MSGENALALRNISERLDKLIELVELLTKLVAISLNKNAFDGKKKAEQISLLDEFGLTRNLMAIIVDSTPESVSSLLSQIKAGKIKV